MNTSVNGSKAVLTAEETSKIIEVYLAKQEKHRKYSQAYYQNNKEKCLERNRQWRKANPEKVHEYSQAYYQNHKEKCLEYGRQWRKANPEKVRAYNRAHYQKRKDEIQALKDAVKEATSNRGPVRFKVDVSDGGFNASMSNEERYQAMKKAGRVNCTFESFTVAMQMINLGNSILRGTASM